MSNIEVRLQEKTSCVTGYISWVRLDRHLQLSGELREGESIANLVADDGGIKYYVNKLQNEETSVK